MSLETERKAATASGAASLRDDPRRYRIVPIGSGPRRGEGLGWAIERDGKIWRTDAFLASRPKVQAGSSTSSIEEPWRALLPHAPDGTVRPRPAVPSARPRE
jgi:hypothetical protein